MYSVFSIQYSDIDIKNDLIHCMSLYRCDPKRILPSFGQCVPWSWKLDDMSLVWCIPWTMHPLDDASLTSVSQPSGLGVQDQELHITQFHAHKTPKTISSCTCFSNQVCSPTIFNLVGEIQNLQDVTQCQIECSAVEQCTYFSWVM